MAVTITQNVADVTGASDTTPWVFCSVLRDQSGTIITQHPVSVTPVSGVLTVQLEPGPAQVTFDGKTYDFTVPATSSDLWSLIVASVTIPSETADDVIAAAVQTYLTAHPPGGGGSGTVTGPNSSVTNNIASFSNTTGEVLKDSGVATDGTGKIAASEYRLSGIGDANWYVKYDATNIKISGSGSPGGRFGGFWDNDTSSWVWKTDLQSGDTTNAGSLSVTGDVSAANLSGTNTGDQDLSALYTKPAGGIPSSDLASAVQSALAAAGTAYQKPGSGIPESDLAASVQTAVNQAASAVAGSVDGTATALTLWTGTQAQYDAIVSKDAHTVYVVTA